MKKIMLLSSIFLFSSSAWSSETIKWDVLRTLRWDAATHKMTSAKELQSVLGKEIKIKGFMLPLDYNAKQIVEFLFMPYIPSCSCVPPPPPNQMILVKMKKGQAIQPSYYPNELTGKLSVKDNQELESSFEMEGSHLLELKE